MMGKQLCQFGIIVVGLFMCHIGMDSGVASQGQGICESGWTDFNGFCYRYFSFALNKSQAADTCKAHNSSLIDVQSAEENSFAVKVMNDVGAGESWLGMTYKSQRRVWDRTGADLSYTNWRVGDPRAEEKCAIILTAGETWESEDCFKNKDYICKKDADECRTMCKNNTNCTNNIGSYECFCAVGFTGNASADSCREISCNITSNDPNLMITPDTNPAKWGSTVSFSCKSGFVLVNLTANTSTCTGEGQNGWNVSFPQCKSATTTSPPLTSPTAKGDSSMASSSASLPSSMSTHSLVNTTGRNETSSSDDDETVIIIAVAVPGGIIILIVPSGFLLRKKYLADKEAKKPPPESTQLDQPYANIARSDRVRNDYEHTLAGGLNGESQN